MYAYYKMTVKVNMFGIANRADMRNVKVKYLKKELTTK